ncbi:MAG: TVP38/TMEM64 family protein [Pyrinomonadaceae bacterium]
MTAAARNLWRGLLLLLAVVGAIALYRQGWRWQSPDQLLSWGAGCVTALIIIAIITATLTCGLTASIFLVITPLLFPPHWSALITTIGFTLGTLGGYLVGRFVGGEWAARFRHRRLHRFLTRHSSFLALFGMRLVPASPHSVISYAAGLAEIPLPRLLAATFAGLAIKSYVYASAINQTLNAESPAGVLNTTTLLSLLAVAALAFAGHMFQQRMFANAHVVSAVEGRIDLKKS